jgi:hypothetical protein
MKPLSLISLFGLSLGYLFALPVPGYTTVSPTTITLEKAVHFVTPDGNDIVVQAGSYGVEEGDKQLRLTGLGDDRILSIEAQQSTHEQHVDLPVAITIPGEGESSDLLLVALLLPDQSSLETFGSYSGVRGRGFRDRVQQFRENARQAAANAVAFAQQKAREAAVLACKTALKTRPASLGLLAPVKTQAAPILQDPKFKQLVQDAIQTLFREKAEVIRMLVDQARVWIDPRNREKIKALLGGERLCERPFHQTWAAIAQMYDGQPQPRSVLLGNNVSWTFTLAGEAAYFGGVQGSIGIATPNLPVGLLPKPDFRHGRMQWTLGGTLVADIDAKGSANAGLWFEPMPQEAANKFELSVKGGGETGLGAEVEFMFGWDRIRDEWSTKKLKSLVPHLAGIEVAMTGSVTPGLSGGLDIGYTRVTRFAW